MDDTKSQRARARMRIFDTKFQTFKTRYILQCFLTACAVGVVLLLLNTISDTVIVAALGASSFVVFTMPGVQASKPRFLIGGYIVGTIVGCLCHRVATLPFFTQLILDHGCVRVIFGALAVGLAMFLMVITDTEHSPAAGLALGFVLNDWDHVTVGVVILGVVSLTILKLLLKPILIDLL